MSCLIDSIDDELADVGWPYMSLPLYVLKSHERFTYVSPNVFGLQDVVQVSFSAHDPVDSLRGCRFALKVMTF